MFNQQPAGNAPSPAVGSLNPELVQKFLDAASQGQFGPQAKQMAEAAQGRGQAPQAPQDGQQPQGADQTAQPPQPGRTLASKHIFGRPGMAAPQGNDGDQDDDPNQQKAPMAARNIFGR